VEGSFSEVRGQRVLGTSASTFRELLQSRDTLDPEGEDAPDVTKRWGNKVLLSLQEGVEQMIRTVASLMARWVGSDRRER
jgi:hypothetical protein